MSKVMGKWNEISKTDFFRTMLLCLVRNVTKSNILGQVHLSGVFFDRTKSWHFLFPTMCVNLETLCKVCFITIIFFFFLFYCNIISNY